MDTFLAIASFVIGLISLVLGIISLRITIKTMINTNKIKDIIDLNDLKEVYKVSNTYNIVAEQIKIAKIDINKAIQENTSCKSIILNPLITVFSELSPYYQLFGEDKEDLLKDSQTIKELHENKMLSFKDISKVSDIINRTQAIIIKRGGNK